MHITQHTDYALRVLIYLGSNTDRLVTIREIAERFDISRTHLMKVVNRLISEKFVEGIRGNGGGLRLGCAAASIIVGDVVRRVERDMELVECFAEGCNCILDPNCKLKSTLQNALQAFLRVLDQVTLADLLDTPETHLLQVLWRVS